MQKPEISKEDLEARGSSTSGRRRTPLRRLYQAVGIGVGKILIRLLWASYRVEKVIGADIADNVLKDKSPYAPCIWHQHLILGARQFYLWRRNYGFLPCTIISPSVDGDVPTKLCEDWGCGVIRGSANSSGAKVLRDMLRMFRNGYSVITAADGPTGPNRVFKNGVALMARMADVPMLPVAFAANRAWYLRRWDNFMIPKPFARIVVAFGEPVRIPADTAVRELDPWRVEMEDALNRLVEQSNNVFVEKME